MSSWFHKLKQLLEMQILRAQHTRTGSLSYDHSVDLTNELETINAENKELCDLIWRCGGNISAQEGAELAKLQKERDDARDLLRELCL